MKGKRGWIRILEATIAVLIVAVAMVSVYSEQKVTEVNTLEETSNSIQSQILEDIAENKTLRLAALSVEEDLPGDENYDILVDYVEERVPDNFGYLVRVCHIGDTSDYCKMDSGTFVFTMYNDVFVEDTVVSSEIGDGTGEEVYNPVKVRIFFWEGGFSPEYCISECVEDDNGLSCSADARSVLNVSCGNFDDDRCLELGGTDVYEECSSTELCDDGECIESIYSKLTCGAKVDLISGSTGCGGEFQIDDECAGYDDGRKTGESGCNVFWEKDKYQCWNWDYEETGCQVYPNCSEGYSILSVEPCLMDCMDSCSSLGFECGVQDVCGSSRSCGTCDDGEACSAGTCVESSSVQWICHKRSNIDSGCVAVFDGQCDSYDAGMETGSCGTDNQWTSYECWDVDEENMSECGESPSCPVGFDMVGSEACVGACVPAWTPLANTVCSGTSFTQVDGCGNSQTVYGTKSCAASVEFTFEGVSYQYTSGYHYYYHDRVFTETAGVGVTFTSGKVCYADGTCNSGSANRRLEADGELIIENQYLFSQYSSNVFTITYYGTDDNGNSISVSESMSVSGSSWSFP